MARIVVQRFDVRRMASPAIDNMPSVACTITGQIAWYSCTGMSWWADFTHPAPDRDHRLRPHPFSEGLTTPSDRTKMRFYSDARVEPSALPHGIAHRCRSRSNSPRESQWRDNPGPEQLWRQASLSRGDCPVEITQSLASRFHEHPKEGCSRNEARSVHETHR